MKVIALTPEASFENDHANEFPPANEFPVANEFPPGDDWAPAKSRWQENHGNLLIAFVGLILLIGSIALIYRQNRFVPPRFPDSDMIDLPSNELDATATPLGPTDVIILRVTGAANDQGSIKVAIYENEESFNDPDSAFAANSLALENNQATWVIPIAGLPERIAIAAYHDENEDQQLTLNRLGIPTERYGFSRNARGLTGPPSFKQTVIDRPAGGEVFDLFIR